MYYFSNLIEVVTYLNNIATMMPSEARQRVREAAGMVSYLAQVSDPLERCEWCGEIGPKDSFTMTEDGETICPSCYQGYLDYPLEEEEAEEDGKKDG